MTEQTRTTLSAAEKAVSELIAVCAKDSHLYVLSPKTVAQVSRTGKWLLNAIAQLRREFKKLQDDALAQKE